jgi:hypothetical protein
VDGKSHAALKGEFGGKINRGDVGSWALEKLIGGPNFD